MKSKVRIIIYLWIVGCIVLLCGLVFKHPTKQVLVGNEFKDAKHLTIKNQHCYEQSMLVQADTITNLMFVIDQKTTKGVVEGNLNVSVFDNNYQEILTQQYALKDLPKSQTNINLGLPKRQKTGEKYYVQFSLDGSKNTQVQLLTLAAKPGYVENGVPHQRAIALYHDKLVADKTCFWYPVYGLALGVFVLLISGDKRHEKA